MVRSFCFIHGSHTPTFLNIGSECGTAVLKTTRTWNDAINGNQQRSPNPHWAAFSHPYSIYVACICRTSSPGGGPGRGHFPLASRQEPFSGDSYLREVRLVPPTDTWYEIMCDFAYRCSRNVGLEETLSILSRACITSRNLQMLTLLSERRIPGVHGWLPFG